MGMFGSRRGRSDGFKKKNIKIMKKIDPSIPLNIFISYAHKDEELFQELLKFLKPMLRRNKNIVLWHDKEILAGEDWNKAITGKLKEADMCLLLITQNFISSDYINEVELTAFLEKYEKERIRIIPVILKSSTWKEEEFARFQAVPRPPLPLDKWPSKDEAFTNIVYEIKKAIIKAQEERR